MIATLTNQNPKLLHVSFYRISLTDAALTSLAQLQHLTDVRLYQHRNVTIAGVLTLLRGSSRNLIRKFIIGKAKVDGDQLSREISLICEERGTTFAAPETGRFLPHPFDYVIHA